MAETTLTTVVPAARAGALRGRLAVAWWTVLPLAALMAYADGFWLTSLRGAVGAIERSQGPFSDWMRESTLVLPVFVVATVLALQLALRLFGPAVSTFRRVVATTGLVALAGTVVGVAEVTVSSVYDYLLQADQLRSMQNMHGLCDYDCLAEQQHRTLMVHVHSVLYASWVLLATNLVLVGWLAAMRGGRIAAALVPSDPPPARSAWSAVRSWAPASQRVDRAAELRIVAAVALVGSAAIHAAVVREHLTEWAAAGLFFVLLTVVELVLAAALLRRPTRRLVLLVAAASAAPLAIWAVSRTAGLPFGPAPGVAEAVGLPDVMAGVLELGTILVAAVLLRRDSRLALRRPASAHAWAAGLVALIATTTIGLSSVELPVIGGPAGSGAPSSAHGH